MTDQRTATEDRPDAAAAATCDRCGERFHTERLLALHRGVAHPDDLTPAERDAYDEAYDAEESDLRLFRLKALAALVLIYFGFLFAYSVFA